MENNKEWLKTDANIVIHEKYIIWIKKMSDCLEVCTKTSGCNMEGTHRICKIYNPYSYDKLNKHFE